MDKYPAIIENIYEFLTKIFLPASVAVTIKLATQTKRQKLTFTSVIISFVTGVGCAYFVFPFVSGRFTPLIIGIVAMSGEKIAEYIIYKWDVDKLLNTLLGNGVSFVVNILKGKQ